MPKQPVENLANYLTKKTVLDSIGFWIVGDTPLITHAWSHKAKQEMLAKQLKATKPGREAKDPDQDFVDSMYPMGKDGYGFPVTGVKECILSAAHKDKGIPRTQAMTALHLNAEMTRVMPALHKAICDMPLVRVWGSEPQMREDMVRVGAGLKKTATIAYRAQFWPWAMYITGRLNRTIVTPEQLAFLVAEAGIGYGIGEWRNERRGIFGSFHIADENEQKLWTAFSRKRGPMPLPEGTELAAE